MKFALHPLTGVASVAPGNKILNLEICFSLVMNESNGC